MKVISKKIENEPKRLTCENCGAILEWDESDITYGVMGCGEIVCPECGHANLMDEYSELLDENTIEFPRHFFHFGGSDDAKSCTDAEIQQWARECVKDLKQRQEEYGVFTYRGTGNTKVIAIKFEDEYDITVAQDYYSLSVPRD